MRRTSSLVRYGYNERGIANCKSASNSRPKSGQVTGLQRISLPCPLAIKDPHHRNKSAAPICSTDSDHVSTAPKARTAKVTKTHTPIRMIFMDWEGKILLVQLKCHPPRLILPGYY